MGLEKYGPAFLGQDKFDEVQNYTKSTAGGKYGPAFTGGATEPADTLSIAELTAVLEADPSLATEHFEAEMGRPAGPRKGALKALAAVADEELATEIEEALE